MIRDLGSETKHIVRWFFAGVVIWTILLSASMYWNYTSQQQKTVDLVTIEAQSHFNKDKAFRFWGASHGGVYVPETEHTPANPRLAHIPERDITTPSGKKLTLMNPAYMIRMMMSDYEALYGVKGKITTFPDKLFYQGNMPDEWELAALRSFQQGEKEAKEIAYINGVPHMRLMQPLYIKEDCLKCHGDQGYKVGDLRGAVGVSVSMQPYLEAEQEVVKTQLFTYLFLWLTGLLVMTILFIRSKAHAQELFNLEEQFQQAQKLEAIGTLVGGIAHEFNNALAGMTGNLFLAKQKASHLPDVVNRLDAIERLAFRSAELIKSLLSFARKGIVQKTSIPLSPFLKEIIKLYQASLPENIKLNSDIEISAMKVHADASLLQQVLVNIINNARDAVLGVENPSISIRLSRFDADSESLTIQPESMTGNYACISISDNGIGIKAGDLPHVFEPFYTTKDVGKGTGLGLSMAYGTMQAHGGVIDIKSVQGEEGGTLVRILLPLHEDRVEGNETEEADIAHGHGETILLVDDNSGVLATGIDVLEGLNYKVLTASDGREAMDVYTANIDRVALVLMDVVMPVMGGVEAAKHLRELNPELKVIFSTAYDQDSLRASDNLDSEAVITKPFKIHDLSNLLKSKLDG